MVAFYKAKKDENYLNLALYRAKFRYDLKLTQGQEYLLSSNVRADVYIPGYQFEMTLIWNGDYISYDVSNKKGELEYAGNFIHHHVIDDFVLITYESDYKVFSTVANRTISVSSSNRNNIRIQSSEHTFALLRNEQDDSGKDSWNANLVTGEFYHNNCLVSDKEFTLEFGDELSFFCCDEENGLYHSYGFKVFPDELIVFGEVDLDESFVEIGESKYGFSEDYPDYLKSPRIVYRPNFERIEINPPSNLPQMPENEFFRIFLPPTVMVALTIFIASMQPNAGFIYITLAMSAVTVVLSLQSYIKQKQKYKVEIAERERLYDLYLIDKAKQLTEYDSEQRRWQSYHYPDIEAVNEIAATYNHRIYENSREHDDFLAYRLGVGELEPTYELSYKLAERSGLNDPLEKRGYELYLQHKQVQNLPLSIDLMNGPVAYVGPRDLVLEQIFMLVSRIAVFHSHLDLQIVSVMNENERKLWNNFRFLPHASLHEINVRGFVHDQRSRDLVLNNLYQVLFARKLEIDSSRGANKPVFLPHYVVIVSNRKLIMDHKIMEFLTEDSTIYGCSVLFVDDFVSALPENVKTIVNFKDGRSGEILLERGELKRKKFKLDRLPVNFDKELISRRLAPINHLHKPKSSIPESICFLEMFGVEKVEELDVEAFWSRNSVYKSLAAPIGARGEGELVYLDLHEKAHGPHGLIAGTTGSGKSELIQTLIASLALYFDPNEVAFLLIDYKGGGMANLLKDLPHVLGIITNLDGNQSMRALISVRAELKRRQAVFLKHEVNHINQYQKLFENGDANLAIPHLFIISDEFAELKSEQPEFMKELVSISRIGRSLGIHLILATQKPAGVVDDQIWSNSRFKIALKVADRQDSMEMLKTSDAADIVNVGRGYLQVGNNEIYELFQSAWSGKDYRVERENQGYVDERIYRINEWGQYHLLNEDLSGLSKVESFEKIPSELEVVIDHIKRYFDENGRKKLPQPWLPPLPERIHLEQLEPIDIETAWAENNKQDLKMLIGLSDIPQNQAQDLAYVNFCEEGSVALYGSPGYGKTAFLQTVVIDLARKYSPERVNFYLLDFGTNGLAPLRSLPHVVDHLSLSEKRKIEKFIRILLDEVGRRKRLLNKHAISSMDMYRQIHDASEPSIVIVLDGFEAMRDESFEENLYSLLINVARESLSLDIHLVITAGRKSSVRSSLEANIKQQMTLPQNEVAEVRSIVGSSPLTNDMEDIKGRILMKREEVDVVQIALPCAGENDVEINLNLTKLVSSFDTIWKGMRPKPIPMVPDELTEEDYLARDDIKRFVEQGMIPFGLDEEKVVPVGIKAGVAQNLVLISDQDSHADIAIRHVLFVLNNLTEDVSLVLLDPARNYEDWAGLVEEYTYESVEAFVELWEDELKARMNGDSYRRVVCLIPDFVSFLDQSSLVEDRFAELYDKGPKYKMHFIVSTMKNSLNQFNSVTRALKNNLDLAMLTMRLYDQSFIDSPYLSGEPRIEPSEAYFFNKGKAIKIKLSKQEGRE